MIKRFKSIIKNEFYWFLSCLFVDISEYTNKLALRFDNQISNHYFDFIDKEEE
jgi:hypothetical protein